MFWVGMCRWCGIDRSWRSRLWCPFGFCLKCHYRVCSEAGIYLQSGGPGCARNARVGYRER